MSKKYNAILQSARDLFSELGFAKTTVAQIAERAGISKGAFYLHFHSKSDLLTAIMELLDAEVKAGVRAIRDREDLSPREKLRAQLRYQFQDVLEHQRLMEMYLQESGIGINEELLLLAQKIRQDWQQIQEEFLLLAFSKRIEPRVTDLAVTLNGALNEYYLYFLLEKVPLKVDRVADYLLEVAEAVADLLIRDTKPAVLTADMLPSREQLERQLEDAAQARIAEAIEAMRKEIGSGGGEEAKEARQTLALLREELERDEPRRLVLQGLLANLRDLPALLPLRKRLAAELKLKLV